MKELDSYFSRVASDTYKQSRFLFVLEYTLEFLKETNIFALVSWMEKQRLSKVENLLIHTIADAFIQQKITTACVNNYKQSETKTDEELDEVIAAITTFLGKGSEIIFKVETLLSFLKTKVNNNIKSKLDTFFNKRYDLFKQLEYLKAIKHNREVA